MLYPYTKNNDEANYEWGPFVEEGRPAAAPNGTHFQIDRQQLVKTMNNLNQKCNPKVPFTTDHYTLRSEEFAWWWKFHRKTQEAWRIKVLKMSFQDFWFWFLFLWTKTDLKIQIRKKFIDSLLRYQEISSKKTLNKTKFSKNFIFRLVPAFILMGKNKNLFFVLFRGFSELISWYLRRLSMNFF